MAVPGGATGISDELLEVAAAADEDCPGASALADVVAFPIQQPRKVSNKTANGAVDAIPVRRKLAPENLIRWIIFRSGFPLLVTSDLARTAA